MDLVRLIEVARGREPADLLLANARVVDLFNHDIIEADVTIAGERIAGLRPAGSPTAARAREVHDLKGNFVAPGLIDGHVHIESSLLSIPEFTRAVVPHGTTTTVIDPHEIANVLGMDGIRYMLESAKYNPLSVFVMASSCVPAGPFESAGAQVTAADIAALMQHEWVLGLAEMMDYPRVLTGDEEVLAKIRAAGARPIDGHAPGLAGADLDAYVAAGIHSDHECTTVEEAREKLRRGMLVMIREASSARNLQDLLPLVTPQNGRRFAFVTDDRSPIDLVDDGHIDSMVRQAIALGLDPFIALQLGSLNAAEYFGLHDRGAVAPGRRADLIVFDDLTAPRPRLVYRYGRLAARDGEMLPFERPRALPSVPRTMDVPRGALYFRTPAQGRRIRVIEVIPNQIITRAGQAEAVIAGGEAVADPPRDLLKLAVIERHTGSGRVGLGFVRGFGLRTGALAGSVAHDAHNIIVVGAGDHAMRMAAEAVVEMGGGLVAVAGGRVVRLPLPIAGLMSDRPLPSVAADLRALRGVAKEMGSALADPFMTLSFMGLSVIPTLKITDRGLLDVTRGELVPLFIN
ncbi:MAG: adenine deaminase [Armatimonadetes bacterium]|nr:adenine deaminase [Armatimonadota bacterium]